MTIKAEKLSAKFLAKFDGSVSPPLVERLLLHGIQERTTRRDLTVKGFRNNVKVFMT